jgi:hypothetical protein
MLVVAYIAFVLIRGSEKFPSLIGITSCSMAYWIVEAGIFAMAIWFYQFNKSSLNYWTAPTITLGE